MSLCYMKDWFTICNFLLNLKSYKIMFNTSNMKVSISCRMSWFERTFPSSEALISKSRSGKRFSMFSFAVENVMDLQGCNSFSFSFTYLFQFQYVQCYYPSFPLQLSVCYLSPWVNKNKFKKASSFGGR